MYDSRTGRRWETDPIIKPWESPYSTFRNNSIVFVDPNGDDWFYYQSEGEASPGWHWHEGSTYAVQVGYSGWNKQFVNLTGQKTVVVFDGSRSEHTSDDLTFTNNDAINAAVTLYTKNGLVYNYDGYTMTSNAPNFTAINEGVYSITDDGSDKIADKSVINKRFRVKNGTSENIPTMDCKPNQNRESNDTYHKDYKNGIMVHNTGSSDGVKGHTSTGCILIPNSQWKNDDNTGFYDIFVNELDKENKRALLILNREGSPNNPSLNGVKENTKMPSYMKPIININVNRVDNLRVLKHMNFKQSPNKNQKKKDANRPKF